MNATGIFFFVVGPSGAGKDSLIDGFRTGDASRLGRFVFARRVITRPAGSAGEDHEPMDDAGFDAIEARDGFLITWQAHGLKYGLRRELLDTLAAGSHVIANGSRAMIAQLASRVPRFVVVEVTAPPEVLFTRIMRRGRETAEQVQARVSRKVEPSGVDVQTISVANDSTVEAGVERFIAALHEAIATPQSMSFMRRKMNGEALDEQGWRAVLDDIIEGRYTPSLVDDFLITACQSLSDDEVVAVAKVRASQAPRIDWNESIVVDKHSMGGIPGSRITLIVVPIVAAFGLIMPKTSSRAITSAAGTADAMETVAKVDLSPEDVHRCVDRAHACIAWNGGLNHSVIDDRVNSLTRPLGLSTNRWSVASILSKKYSAGSTHVIIDIPMGPRAKLRNEAEADELAALFETVGRGLGMTVRALVTDGTGPIGRGIGPALEVRDVMLVLDGSNDAPPDLRAKALAFASTILAWSPDIGNAATAEATAEELLRSGAARAAFDRIVDAQGRREPAVLPSGSVREILCTADGVVAGIDGWHIAGVARAAGAPQDPGAGVDLCVSAGKRVVPGDVLYVVHGNDPVALGRASEWARTQTGILITTSPC